MPKRTWLVGLLVAALLGAGGIVVWRPSLPEPKQVLCRRGPMDPGDPFGIGGTLMTTADAERSFDPPLVRPQIDIASDATIDELWVRPSPGGRIFIDYDSGILVTVGPWSRKTWEYARAVEAEGSPGELITVHGTYVFTVRPDPPCFGGNAVFNVGGAHVAVINDGDLPFEDVRRVTESIIETAPAVIAEDRALDEG